MKRSLLSRSNAKGFTLVELLIVIVIIGILAAALLPRVAGAPARARDESRKADINSMVTALEQYNGDMGYYPTSSTANTTSCLGVSADATSTSLIPAYVQDIPADPSTGSLPVSSGCTGGYFYKTLTNGSTNYTNYILIAKLERPITAPTDGVYCTGTTPAPGTFVTYPASIATINGYTACGSGNTSGYYIVVR